MPSAVPKHYKERHAMNLHQNLTQSTISRLQERMNEGHFAAESDKIKCPELPCAPFDGLLIQDGFACNLCNYCGVSSHTMDSHHRRTHKKASGTAKDNRQKVQVQAFFAQHPRYFAVNPSLHGMNKDDFFAVYMKDYAPKIEAFSHFNPPINVNEVPPLLKVMQWHQHLDKYTTDKETVSQLLEIWKLPNISQCEDWIGKRLRSTIKGYMKDIQKKALETPPGIRCLLLTCPRFVLSSHQHTMLRSYDLGLHKMTKSGNHFKMVNLLLPMLDFCINGPMLFWLPLKAMNLVMSSL